MSDSASEHTEKWALGLASQGITVGLFSFNKSRYPWYKGVENIELLFESQQLLSGSAFQEKISYFKYVNTLKQKIKEFQPDILHAHYASSYGLIAALSGFKIFGVSVWGSDVYDFPKQNWIYKKILKYVLSKATFICSTSYCMKNETLKYTKKAITVTPFGIDIDKFNRTDAQLPFQNLNEINIGNIKAIENKYGVDILIKSFHKVVIFFPDKNIKLYFIGDGSEKENCKKLIADLGITNKVVFTGRIAHNEIPKWHQKLDIFASLSVLDSESFGVSLVEAMSSKSCIIASDVAGFIEVLGEDNSAGIIVPKNSIDEVANAFIDLINNPQLAIQKANKARERAVSLYNWQDNIKQMMKVYQGLLKEII
jgi:glycosyltransferase involved in cell wall biosynthesis